MIAYFTWQIIRTARLEDTGIGIKIGGIAINNLRCADDSMIIGEDLNDLEFLGNKEKHASAEVGLKLNLTKT